MTSQIVDLLNRYATGIDRRDWDLFRTCFTPDVVCDYGDIGQWNGVEEITAFMQEVHTGPSMHRLTNYVIDIDGDRATARTYVQALVLGPDSQSGVDAIGYYDDVLVRSEDDWRIASRTFTAVRVTYF